MDVYISVDIEGIAGVTSRNHSGPAGIDYGRARDWMTRVATKQSIVPTALDRFAGACPRAGLRQDPWGSR